MEILNSVPSLGIRLRLQTELTWKKQQGGEAQTTLEVVTRELKGEHSRWMGSRRRR